MDYLRGNICWEEQGTFVYEVLTDDATVRTHPSVNDHHKTDIHFSKGDLVAIDLVRPSRVPADGSFLRLSDGCGWLLEQRDGKAALTRRDVETGLWSFFVDNFPLGQALVRHPVVNRLDLVVSPQAMYPPMRKIYCDRRVTSTRKVEFFRVQGTKGWIVGRGIMTAKKRAASMLLPETKVKSGIFAYQCMKLTSVYNRPNRNDSFVTRLTIEPNELVMGNLVRESSDGSKFIRLIDGSGWVPVTSNKGDKCLDMIPTISKTWRLQCVSASPIHLLRQPIDRDDMLCESKTTYKMDSEVECDQKITSFDGVSFYRVKGTEGYLPDKRGDEILLQPVTNKDLDLPDEGGWTPDFVRGIASLVPGVYESKHDDEARVLSFASSEVNKPVINVHYSSRMVWSYPSGGPSKKDCLPKDVAEILRDPTILKNEKEEQPPLTILDVNNSAKEVCEQEEAFLRHKLVECYIKSEKLKKRQLEILRVLKQCDDQRGEKDRTLAERTAQRGEELQQLETQRIEQEQQRLRLTCDECSATFPDLRAKQKHWRSVHGHICEICDAAFESLNELVEHQDEPCHHRAIDKNSLSRSNATNATASLSSFEAPASSSSASVDEPDADFAIF